MQHFSKNTTKNPKSIFVQTVKTSEPCYHPLFETFQNDVLLLGDEGGAIPHANNPNGLLAFCKVNTNPHQDFAMLSAEQQVASEDRLFLSNLNTHPTENREDINLPGIDQLPSMIDGHLREIRDRDDAANLIHTLAKFPVQNPKFTATEKR